MAQGPVFNELRDLDEAVEREVGKYLDDYLYCNPVFDKTQRNNNVAGQRAGDDIVISSTQLGMSDTIIDEKSAAHHVNNLKLHTFAFELSFYRKDNNGNYTILTEGWLTSPIKVTEYYMLVWPFAKEDRIIKYGFGGKDYPYFTKKDIIKLDYALVSRNVVREYLKSQGFDEKWLGITMSTIRKHAANQEKSYYKERFRNLTFSCSAQLKEKPVNVLIEKEDLYNMAILSGSC